MNQINATNKTFLQRLEHLQAELRAVAQSQEIRQLIGGNYYDPDLTIIDAIEAVSEVIDAYEQNYCVFHLQAGGSLRREEIQNLIPTDDDLGIPFC
jgi:hypothetical protein